MDSRPRLHWGRPLDNKRGNDGSGCENERLDQRKGKWHGFPPQRGYCAGTNGGREGYSRYREDNEGKRSLGYQVIQALAGPRIDMRPCGGERDGFPKSPAIFIEGWWQAL